MAAKLQPVRGTHDILPEEFHRRRFLADTARRTAELYGFEEMSTPVFEFSDVFHRTLGDASDVVTKETYSFEDRGGEHITLRPEFTAATVRAFLSNGLQNALPVKWFYHGPAFRYERPQKGRMRQFHQFGAELLGVGEPAADVELIALAAQILEALGLKDNVTLHLNSLGDAESRAGYRDALVAYFTEQAQKLSEESRIRLQKNPMRILDSKDEQDRQIVAGAPSMEAYFTAESREFFDKVREGLEALGVEYTHNKTLVRGLDYYTHTVFEFIAKDGLGAQSTVLAGGRYDGLVELMGGAPTPGIGWAAGIERLLMLVDFGKVAGYAPPRSPIAVIPVGSAAEEKARLLSSELRKCGYRIELAYRGNLSKRMKQADRVGAVAAVIIGEEELEKDIAVLRDMRGGEQRAVPMQELASALRPYNE